MIENEDLKIDQKLVKALVENQYPYYFSETEKTLESCQIKVLALSEQALWSCQSLEFGREMGLALRDLHHISCDSESAAKAKLTLRPQMNFRERLKSCENLWRKHESQFEEVGFPIAVLRDVFMGYEDLEVENEQVILHGNLSSSQVLLNENMEFLGFSDWGQLQIGNRGLDIALAWMIFEEPVAKAFFTAYGPVEESQFELSLFQSLYHPMIMLPRCFALQNENLKQWTVFALRKAIGL